MRGQGMNVEELMKLFLVFLIGIGVIILILFSTGHMEQLINDFCEKNPQLCGASPYIAEHDVIATASFEALACAIKATDNGGDSCVEKFREVPRSPLTGNVLAQEEGNNATVECDCGFPEFEYEEDYLGVENLMFRFEGGEWQWKLKSSGADAYKNIFPFTESGLSINYLNGIDKVYAEKIIVASPVFRENGGLHANHDNYEEGVEIFKEALNANKLGSYGGDDFIIIHFKNGATTTVSMDSFEDLTALSKSACSCTVTNFQLPQEITAAQEWIKGMGDPLYLVYWQEFPAGEDNWNHFSSWFENLMDIGFAWLGTGKVIKLGTRTLMFVPKAVAKKVGKKFAATAEARAAAKIARIKDVNARFIATFAPDIVEKQSKGIISSARSILAKPLKIPAKVLRATAVVGIAAGSASVVGATALAAYIDSTNQKYIPFEDSLVLKLPYVEPETYELEMEGRPVFLAEREMPLHLASPCVADIEVDNNVVSCERYGYNFITGRVSCDGADISDVPSLQGKIACDNDKNITKYLPDPIVPELINKLDTKEKLKLFEFTDDGKFILNEPVTGMTFVYGETTGQYDFDAAPIKRLEELRFNYKGTEHIFGPFQTGTFENDDVKIRFDLSYFTCTDMRDRDQGFVCTMELADFVVKNQACEACKELKKHLHDNMHLAGTEIEFKQMKDEFEAEGGNEEERKFWELRFVYKAGDYVVALRDSGGESDSSGKQIPDGFVDFIGIEEESGIIEDFFGVGLPDGVILTDIDYDGVFDTLSVDDCSLVSPTVSVTKRDTGERNYCFSQKSFTRTIFSWAPEIGLGIGTVVGGVTGAVAASPTGPGALVAAGAGAAEAGTFGMRIGAGIYTLYTLGERKWGTDAEWPGKESDVPFVPGF